MMKYLKNFLFYCFLLFFLSLQYDEKTIQAMILHYPFIDFRYLIFIAIQFFWTTLLFSIIYQYICLYTFLRIRLSLFQSFSILIKQLVIYCFFFLFTHFFLFTFLEYSISFHLLFTHLLIQVLGFILVILVHKDWNYSYFLMISFILFIHFVV